MVEVSSPPPSAASATRSSYAGERLGLPSAGRGSVAGWGRRILALCLDWAASLLVSAAFVGADVWTGRGAVQWLPMAVFAAETTLLTTLLGGSFGQLVLRIAVVRLDGRPVTILHALARTLLICLVVPPMVFNPDQRGLHDLAVKTVVVRR